MLKAFKCPKCQGGLQTDQEMGEKITCPHCDRPFTLRPSHAVDKNSAGEAFAKIAIPIGYVLFVAIPLVGTIWYFSTRTEDPPKKPPEVAEVRDPDRDREREPEKEKKLPVPPRPPRKVVTPGTPGTPVDPEDPDPKENPDPKPPDPKPKGVEVAVAPEPREVQEVELAPEPREILWKIPYTGYESKWQTVGLVDLRVAGVAVSKAPIIDGKGQVKDSPNPMLVIAIETRVNVPNKKRELSSWTAARRRYSAAFLASGKELFQPELPLGSKYNTGLPVQQLMPPDCTPVRDLLIYELPPPGAGELSLRLEADRVNESGDIWFKIPESAWKR
jgi:hypothetical protein